ncbi:MAG: hypothetical protein KKD50_08000 [Proteobacteria bacterium]|nr:hypothetical protein [Pseudomonadota bacterium]
MEQKKHKLLLKKLNYSGSQFQGSRLPWRELICILGTIALNATIAVSTQLDREARLGQGFKVKSRLTLKLINQIYNIFLAIHFTYNYYALQKN